MLPLKQTLKNQLVSFRGNILCQEQRNTQLKQNAVPNGKKDDLSVPAVQGVLRCAKLFAIERYCRENGFENDRRSF